MHDHPEQCCHTEGGGHTGRVYLCVAGEYWLLKKEIKGKCH